MNSNKICIESITNKQTFGICLKKIPYLASIVLAYHHRVKMSENALCYKDFQAFRLALVRRLTSAEFVFLFIVSNPRVL